MTKKGTERAERRLHDHYVTPTTSIHRFLEIYRPEVSRILDPCAAKGELIETAKPYFPEAQWAGCEINPMHFDALREVTAGAVLEGDFLANLELAKSCQFDFILTNPPYVLAEEMIRASLTVAPTVAMLLRINFLASKKRRNFLKETNPGIFVLPDRPSFTGGGGDMTEYAWMVFGDKKVAGRIDYCEISPLEAIKEDRQRAREIHGSRQCPECGSKGREDFCADCGAVVTAAAVA